jgi:hypothetical protein
VLTWLIQDENIDGICVKQRLTLSADTIVVMQGASDVSCQSTGPGSDRGGYRNRAWRVGKESSMRLSRAMRTV